MQSATTGKINAIETVRGVAALYVFIGHAIFVMVGKDSPAALPFRFVTEAVMAFFLVSGFAIGTSLLKKPDTSFREYLIRRFARIYPIFVLALAVAQILTLSDGIDPLGIVGNMLMLQDFSQAKPGVIVEQFRNSALWSLSYEWWFYLMFWPIWRHVRSDWQLPIISLVSCAAIIAYNLAPFGPLLFVAFLPTWWAGVEIAKSRAGLASWGGSAIVAWVMLPAFVFCGYALSGWQPGVQFGHHPFLEARQAVACVAFLCIFFAVGWERFEIIGRSRFLADKVAPISYAIYALHFPIVVALMSSGLNGWLGFAVSIPIVFALALVAEGPYQRACNRLLVRSRPPAAARSFAATN